MVGGHFGNAMGTYAKTCVEHVATLICNGLSNGVILEMVVQLGLEF